MNAVIIPRAEAHKYRKILINWHTGIDAIELADGDYFISEECLNMLTDDFEFKKIKIKTELMKLKIKKLKEIDFKVYDLNQ